MPRYDIGGLTNTTATASAVRVELRGATSGERTRVFEIGIFNGAATAGGLLFGRAGAIGVTPTSPITTLGEDTADTGTAQVATAWGTAPTTPTNPMRQFEYPAAIGAGIVWTFPEPMIIPLSGSLILYNRAASSTATISYYFVVG